MAANVIWVLALKGEDGNYYSNGEVYDTFEEGVQEACEAIEDDATCDPRLVQVLLDPNHMACMMAKAVAALQPLMAGVEDTGYGKGVQRCIDALEELGTPLNVDEVEHGGPTT